MEWGHRILGRLIGVVFVGPLVYFAARKKISGAMVTKMSGLAALIGVQGLLGWYMVQSGLEESIMDTPGAVPRVSQYRLAAHLGTAIMLYAGMFGAGLATIKDWKFSKGADWSGVKGISSFQAILSNPSVRAFKIQAWAITGLVFLTALSGKESRCAGDRSSIVTQVPSLLVWMLDYSTTSFLSWVGVLRLQVTNYSPLITPRAPTSLTYGGGTFLRTPSPCNSIIVSL